MVVLFFGEKEKVKSERKKKRRSKDATKKERLVVPKLVLTE